MRMGIVLCRRAMRRPARMRDAKVAMSLLPANLCGQLRHSTYAAHALQAIVQNHQSRRIISTIFEPAQPFQQNGHDIALRDGTDDSTHGLIPWLSSPGAATR